MTTFTYESTRVRRAETKDADALAAMARDLLLYEKSLNDSMGEIMPWAASAPELRKQMARLNTQFLVAEKAGAVVGYIKVQAIGRKLTRGEQGTARWLAEIMELAARTVFHRLLGSPRSNVEEAGGYIAGVFVRPDVRRTHVGQMLIAAAEDWLRSQGMKTSELHVLHANEGARRFWEEAGYEPLTMGMRKKLD